MGHTGDLGGGELALLRLCTAVDRARFAVRVILFADGELRRRLESTGIPVDVIPLDPSVSHVNRYEAGRMSLANLRRAARLVPFGWALVRRLRLLRPDVVQTNTLKAALIGVPVALLACRPLIWYVHDRISEDYLPGPMIRLIRRCARLFPRVVLANSTATARTIAPAPSIVVYPGFSPEQAVPDPSVRVAPAHPVIGLVGRISPTKGQLEFVRAAELVLRRYPAARFRIAGSPMFGAEQYAQRVRAEAAALGVDKAVDWVGFVTDPLAELDRLTVFVHASPVPEPFGQVIVEAMVRGVPVVATRGGGVNEIVAPTGADDAAAALGLLADPGDADQLAGEICHVLDDPGAAARRAQAAYRSALQRFPIAESANQVGTVWRELTRDRRSGRRKPAPR